MHQSHWTHTAKFSFTEQSKFCQVVGWRKIFECLGFGPLLKKVHNGVMYSSFLTLSFFFYIEKNSLFTKNYKIGITVSNLRDKFMLLLRMFDGFKHLLLNKSNWPYFTPLLILLLGIRRIERNFHNLYFNNKLFQLRKNIFFVWFWLQTQ